MEIPTTINHSFNRTIEHLLQFHPVVCLAGPTLDMGKRPIGIRNDRDRAYYLDAVATVMEIGKRNKWLRIHVNRQGRAVFWLLDIPFHCIKKDSKPIWSDERQGRDLEKEDYYPIVDDAQGWPEPPETW